MIVEAKTLDRHIEVNAKIASGKPRIAGHRITVQDVVIWHEWLNKSADEIASEYDLTLSDIYAALAYYYDNKKSLDKSIRESEAFVESLKNQSKSKVAQKINEQTD